MAIPNLLPPYASIASGSIRFDGQQLVGLSENELNSLRWKDISVIFQGALNALNPVQTVGHQIVEPIRLHEPDVTVEQAKERASELLEAVGIPAARASGYPHEFSGGMRQRVMIAMSLACRPKLVIADEPITALDVMTQAQILDLLRSLCDRFGLSLLLISHDLSVLSQTCDRVVVMYAGKVVETGAAAEVFGPPNKSNGAQHPYTQRLLRAYPNIRRERKLIDEIPGYPPDLSQPQQGCRFFPRCDVHLDICAGVEPPLVAVGNGQLAACHLLDARSREVMR
jgi:peptide/nickel transport system ATP-binding protein